MKQLFALVGLAACVVDGPATDDESVSSSSQPIVQRCALTGIYDATAHQTFNTRGVTVRDYRRCTQDSTRFQYLDAAFVADAMGVMRPSYGATQDYRVFAPDRASNGKLLIYISGNGAGTDNREQLLQRAAYLGYHVIAVRYWNDDGGDITTCGRSPSNGSFQSSSPCLVGPNNADPVGCQPYTDHTAITYDDCARRFFLRSFANTTDANEKLPAAFVGGIGAKCSPGGSHGCDGTSVGRGLRAEDATLSRVRVLLNFLASHAPAEDGWGDFPGANNSYDAAPFLDWSRVALMAHSEGSKVFYYAAHDGTAPFGLASAAFDRVILLSGPNLPLYGHENFVALDYIRTPGKTPMDRIYAISNSGDPNSDEAQAAWRQMSGPPTLGSTALQIGLGGDTYNGVWHPHDTASYWGFCVPGQPCGCTEFKPVAPPSGSTIRALLYTGHIETCVDPSLAGDEHPSVTNDDTCKFDLDHDGKLTPADCWYLSLWDYALTNH